MNLETFLEKLEQTPRDWKFSHGQEWIRRGGGECPLSTLLGRNCTSYLQVANSLGMDSALGEAIGDAADGAPLHDPALRAKLLKACGLEVA